MAESENTNQSPSNPTPNTAPATPEIMAEAQLLQWLPICRRTLGTWRAKGLIPSIRVGGRVFYHRKSVEDALLRRQR